MRIIKRGPRVTSKENRDFWREQREIAELMGEEVDIAMYWNRYVLKLEEKLDKGRW